MQCVAVFSAASGHSPHPMRTARLDFFEDEGHVADPFPVPIARAGTASAPTRQGRSDSRPASGCRPDCPQRRGTAAARTHP